MSDHKVNAAFEELISQSGVKLPDGDLEKIRDLARAMREAASVVTVPLDPSVLPATQLRLFGARRS